MPAASAAKSEAPKGEARSQAEGDDGHGRRLGGDRKFADGKEKTGDATFSVDNKTVVSGTGLGTAGRKLMEAGGKPTLGDFVKDGDTVSVTYHDAGGTKTASTVRIVHKKM